jgi:hypothetical protein
MKRAPDGRYDSAVAADSVSARTALGRHGTTMLGRSRSDQCVGAGVYLAGRNMEYQQKAELCDEEPINSPSRLEYFWPAFGVGLLATLVWTLFLGWLLGHALLAIF